MATIIEIDPFQLIEDVPDFDGKAEELEIFMKIVEEIRKHVNADRLKLFDLTVRNKCVRANIILYIQLFYFLLFKILSKNSSSCSRVSLGLKYLVCAFRGEYHLSGNIKFVLKNFEAN